LRAERLDLCADSVSLLIVLLPGSVERALRSVELQLLSFARFAALRLRQVPRL